MQVAQIHGYRLAWGPGDFCFHSPEMYAKEINKEHADVWALYDHPQSGCSPEIAVYRGEYWIQPKYVYPHTKLNGFIALYVGPLINEMPISEEMAFAFPGLMEERLKQSHPELFKKGGG